MENQRHALADTHTAEAIAHRIQSATKHSYLGDFVLGAVDGAVTTFAIVSGAAGAGLSGGVALVLGLANVLADGLSMAAGNFLRARSDQQIVDQYRRIEEHHIDEIPQGEREEVRQIFANKGFDGHVLDEIVEVITSDRRQWVDTMLTDEWGLTLNPPHPWVAGAVTMAAFAAAGCAPLVPLAFNLEESVHRSFAWSATLTGFTFLIVGYFRGRMVDHRPVRSALETLMIGAVAAAAAYFVADWLERALLH